MPPHDTVKFLGSPIIGQPGKVFLVDQAGTNLLEAGSGTTDQNGSFDVIVANNLAPSGYQAELTNGLISNRIACELFAQTH